MILGCIADDNTGASDIANEFAKCGLRTVQMVGVPEGAAPPCDVGVVALRTRSIPAPDAVAQSRDALAWLRTQGCRQYVFKYCSTFDSTPSGNIGPVAMALASELGSKAVVACPSFPANGRTVYQGHLFVGSRLLNESGMERHPLNPMTDPDLCRWLGRQVDGEVGLIPLEVVARGPDAIGRALAEEGAAGRTLVVVDAVSEENLLSIGRACRGAPLVSGASGIAAGLSQNLIADGLASAGRQHWPGVPGPAAVLSGSCAAATLDQVARHAASHPKIDVDIADVMEGRVEGAQLADRMVARLGEEPVLSSSSPPSDVAELQRRYGTLEVAGALDHLFGVVARLLVEAGVERLVVAGGETSGAVVSALGLTGFELGPEIDPGVPALRTIGNQRPLGLALKSGNFGKPDLFSRAIRILGGD